MRTYLVPEGGSTFSVPLVFYYRGKGKPCALKLYVITWLHKQEESKQYQAVQITEIVVTYSDGQSFGMEFAPGYNPTIEIEKNLTGELLIRQVAPMHADAEITLKGNLVKTSGEELPFEDSASFKADSSFDLNLFWLAMAGG